MDHDSIHEDTRDPAKPFRPSGFTLDAHCRPAITCNAPPRVYQTPDVSMCFLYSCLAVSSRRNLFLDTI